MFQTFQAIVISFVTIASIAGALGFIAYFIVSAINKTICKSYLKELITDTAALITIICWGISILEILAIHS